MQKKQETFHKMWHDDSWLEENVVKATEFDYESNIDQLTVFSDTHPLVMQKRILDKNWKFEYDISFNKIKMKDRLKNVLRKYLNIDIRYKNYKKI